MDLHGYKLLIPVTPSGLLFYLLVVILFSMGSHTPIHKALEMERQEYMKSKTA